MEEVKVFDKPFEGCYRINSGPNKGKFTDKEYHDKESPSDEEFLALVKSLKNE